MTYYPQYNLSVESNQNVESKRQSVESKWENEEYNFGELTVLHLNDG